MSSTHPQQVFFTRSIRMRTGGGWTGITRLGVSFPVRGLTRAVSPGDAVGGRVLGPVVVVVVLEDMAGSLRCVVCSANAG